MVFWGEGQRKGEKQKHCKASWSKEGTLQYPQTWLRLAGKYPNFKRHFLYGKGSLQFCNTLAVLPTWRIYQSLFLWGYPIIAMGLGLRMRAETNWKPIWWRTDGSQETTGTAADGFVGLHAIGTGLLGKRGIQTFYWHVFLCQFFEMPINGLWTMWCP